MGSGFKDFQAAATLTAAQLDQYLMSQAVMSFPDVSTRTTDLTGYLEEGMVCYIENLDAFFFYDGSAWKYLSEPAKDWAITEVTQSFAVTVTVRSAWSQRSNGVFRAGAYLDVTSNGAAGFAVQVPTPYAITDTVNVRGTLTWYDASVGTYYNGALIASTANVCVGQRDGQTSQMGISPNLALTSGDVLFFDMEGRYG